MEPSSPSAKAGSASHWLLVALLGVAIGAGIILIREMIDQPGAGGVRKLTGETPPDFPAGGTWINAEKPLDLAGLRGKVVFVHFTFVG